MTEQIKKCIWVILPGGGVYGIYQLGFIAGLLERYGPDEIKIERVYGTSIGAVISPLVATQNIQNFEKVITQIRSIHDVLQPWNFIENALKILPIIRRMGAYKRVSLVDMIVDVVRESCEGDETKLGEVYKQCNVVAWDVINKRETWFSGADLPFGMRASSALPVAVPPVEGPDGTLFADGGVTELYPVTKARTDFDHEENKEGIVLLMIDCKGDRKRPMRERPKNALDYIGSLMNDTIAQLADRELEFIAPSGIKYVCPVTNDVFDSVIDIDPKKIRQAYDEAREVGLQYAL